MEVDSTPIITSTDQDSELVGVTNDQTEMLEQLSKLPDLIVKNQQQSESDLTNDEKFDHLRQFFIKSPFDFLIRFGKFLSNHQLGCFEEFEDENVGAVLKQLKKNMADAKTCLKNRRYAALQKLVDSSDYFTEEEMQRRNPILFHQLIGKFQSKEEKEAFLKRSYDSAACSKTPLTDLLMAHMNRNELGESYRRLDQEKQAKDEDEADAEYFDNDEDDEMEGRDVSASRRGNNRGGEERDEEYEEIEDEEKELLKEEFFTTMYQHFLDGKDADFDYSSVDNNEEYDVGENLELDEEEKYFDEEEPCEVNSESSSEDGLFKPPARCSDIESKIQSLTVQSDSQPQPMKADVASESNHNDEEEDELDAYMKTIERELQKNQ